MDPFDNQQQAPKPYYGPEPQPGAMPPQPPQFMQTPGLPFQPQPQLPFERRQQFRQDPPAPQGQAPFQPPMPGAEQAPPQPAAFMRDPEPMAPAVPDVPFSPTVPPFGQPPMSSGLPRDPQELRPTPVVKVLSPVGVEYVFLTMTLLIGASALTSVLLVLVNGAAGFGMLAFPSATLLVTVPLFALIFLHLKRQELQNPELKLDPSKRRSTQVTQIISFIVCLFTLIGFFAAVMASFGGDLHAGVGKAALDALCVLAVAGGILFYYWRDEHGSRR